jgi:hypothetical protein
MQPTTNYIAIAKNKSLLKHQHRDTIDIEKQYIASCIMFAKRLQWGYERDVAVGVDDDHAGGGRSLSEAIPIAVPPFDLCRLRPADSLFMCF